VLLGNPTNPDDTKFVLDMAVVRVGDSVITITATGPEGTVPDGLVAELAATSARRLGTGSSTGSSSRSPDEPQGPSMDASDAQVALATVLAAENEYHRANNEYTEEHDSDTEALTGVDVGDIVTDWSAFIGDQKGVVFYCLGEGHDEGEIDGALYLGVQTTSDGCYYLRAESPSKVVTAIDAECRSTTSIEYTTSEWELS
jgi:hypothetical protein